MHPATRADGAWAGAVGGGRHRYRTAAGWWGRASAANCSLSRLLCVNSRSDLCSSPFRRVRALVPPHRRRLLSGGCGAAELHWKRAAVAVESTGAAFWLHNLESKRGGAAGEVCRLSAKH